MESAIYRKMQGICLLQKERYDPPVPSWEYAQMKDPYMTLRDGISKCVVDVDEAGSAKDLLEEGKRVVTGVPDARLQ